MSSVGTTYQVVLDHKRNSATRNTIFGDTPPTTRWFVRLKISNWPRTGGAPLGVIEFTAFGKAVKGE